MNVQDLISGWVDDAVAAGFKRGAAHEIVAGVLEDLAAHDEAFAEKLDALVQFDVILPGKLGELIEFGDRVVFKALIGFVSDVDEMFKRDPVQVAFRQKRRAMRKEARRARKSPAWHLKQAARRVIDPEAKASIERALARLEK